MFCFHVCMCTTLVPGACQSQKRMLGFPRARVTNDYELPYGCWELNTGPLQEQQVPLTAEPPLQLLPMAFETSGYSALATNIPAQAHSMSCPIELLRKRWTHIIQRVHEPVRADLLGAQDSQGALEDQHAYSPICRDKAHQRRPRQGQNI